MQRMQCNLCNGTGKRPSEHKYIVGYAPQPSGDGWATFPVMRNAPDEQCRRCRGTGQMKVTYVQDVCPTCKGSRTAWVPAPGTYPSGQPKQTKAQCPTCNGTGFVQGERYSPDYS